MYMTTSVSRRLNILIVYKVQDYSGFCCDNASRSVIYDTCVASPPGDNARRSVIYDTV
jgi:hypothetical protein